MIKHHALGILEQLGKLEKIIGAIEQSHQKIDEDILIDLVNEALNVRLSKISSQQPAKFSD